MADITIVNDTEKSTSLDQAVKKGNDSKEKRESAKKKKELDAVVKKGNDSKRRERTKNKTAHQDAANTSTATIEKVARF